MTASVYNIGPHPARKEFASCALLGLVAVLALVSVVLMALRLGGVVQWSWWLISFPVWGPYAILGVIILVAVTFAGIGKALAPLAK